LERSDILQEEKTRENMQKAIKENEKSELPMLSFGSSSNISRLRRVPQFYRDNRLLQLWCLNEAEDDAFYICTHTMGAGHTFVTVMRDIMPGITMEKIMRLEFSGLDEDLEYPSVWFMVFCLDNLFNDVIFQTLTPGFTS
jgi:hypothetical protein